MFARNILCVIKFLYAYIYSVTYSTQRMNQKIFLTLPALIQDTGQGNKSNFNIGLLIYLPLAFFEMLT